MNNLMSNSMKRKYRFLFIIFILAFILLGTRVAYITIVDGKNYKQAVLQNASNKGGNDLIDYRRGDIVDRNGIVVADSLSYYELILDAKLLLTQTQKVQDHTVAFLSEKLGFKVDELKKMLVDNANSNVVTLGKDYTYEKIKDIKDSIDSFSLVGVFYKESYKRTYPYNNFASDVIGFVGSDNEGSIGLEKYYNGYLSGSMGRRFGVVEDGNNIAQQEIMPTNGDKLVLNIDYSIQKYVEDAIKAYMATYTATNIQVIVMNPNNGEVLGMASYPDFNLNNPKDLAAYKTSEELAVMTSEEKLDFLNSLWNNWAITSTYEPGSTYKPFVYAEAVEENKLKDGLFYCNGYSIVAGRRISCWKPEGHGAQTMQQILENSCNVGFMELGAIIGRDIYYKYQHAFGFGAVTNVDLVGESSARALLNTYDKLNVTELATGSFGQGFNITPMQLITGFCSLVNGGYLYEPHVVNKIIGANGEVVLANDPKLVRQVISQAASDDTRMALKGVVDEGTGHKASIAGYEIGGKTGTAEKIERDDKNYVVSFIGFAPVNDPQVITLVVVDEPRGPKIDSRYAAMIFKDVMEDVMPYLHIFKTDAVSNGAISTSGSSLTTTPNVTTGGVDTTTTTTEAVISTFQ